MIAQDWHKVAFFQLSMSYLEIYQERVTDLLSGKDMRAFKASVLHFTLKTASTKADSRRALCKSVTTAVECRKMLFYQRVGRAAQWD